MTILRRLTSLIALACLVPAVSANDLVEKEMAGAEAGDANSQHMLGWMYENGVGVEEDSVAARIWYRKAAQQGHEGAKSDLERLGSSAGSKKLRDCPSSVQPRRDVLRRPRSSSGSQGGS